ncbi:hypothetical protein HYDPIDRAFT_89380 [Hydnomerulius pinastri MD-312]|uniref:Zn(2)-C6 fungal-type domain-containing protein n=1 Tax=Hydnomerulius pinastri MD-312 TaxID=994086 RepID=A0A0C9W1Z6_9AGAM|nr:hypothetical protein HYDPIDRAFT_89380 [Hydnomerulius pinastri MD-312]
MANYATHPYAITSQTSNPPHHEPDLSHDDDGTGKKKKTTKRRKVNHACLYCRRSHMTCDEGRPCQRCIKREIGHLCHDEQRPPKNGGKQDMGMMSSGAEASSPLFPSSASFERFAETMYGSSTMPQPASSAWPMSVPQGAFLYQPETLGNEFSVLTDFLETLDDGSFFTPPPQTVTPSLMSAPYSNPPPESVTSTYVTEAAPVTEPTSTAPVEPPEAPAEEPAPPLLPSATKTEKFLLTAADQESGSRDERLNRVIRSKYEAGLLKPYDYVKGYARLSRWMDRNVSRQSKQQILQPLSVLRPKFRAVAQSLRDIDLVFIEEAFERLLLDYDRVFSAMGVPACLWRRTGEIYKGNREFTELVGVDGYMMRDGRLCIYELMAEESAVNYWEKYGHVAFDSSQKAVLTSCVLRYKPLINTHPHSSDRKKNAGEEVPNEEGFVNCCFSFTIRRDKWGIPSMIVGNFIKC